MTWRRLSGCRVSVEFDGSAGTVGRMGGETQKGNGGKCIIRFDR
jgi:hypothetical protein